MPPMTFTSILSYIGILALGLGFFLVLTGFGIVKVEKISVTPGPLTWGFGIVLTLLGTFLLLPEIRGVTPIVSPTPTPVEPFFEDEFLRLDAQVWDIEGAVTDQDAISVQNGRLNFDFSNPEEKWASQFISAKNLSEYSAIEFETVIIESSGLSAIQFNTNCHGQDTGSLVTEIGWNYTISGTYELYKNDSVELVNLGWNKSFEIGKTYTVLLQQHNDVVRFYVNGVEMPATFPCDSIGPNLFIGSTADLGHSIKGFVEYVKVWK